MEALVALDSWSAVVNMAFLLERAGFVWFGKFCAMQ